MIRHENDVTNHRIMWLLIVQGLIAYAVVTAGNEGARAIAVLSAILAGVMISALCAAWAAWPPKDEQQPLKPGGEIETTETRQREETK
jgi:hypothetical protein